ncbi:mersacidin/lichenicidin family type 2 lantibiotic [Asanoa sp. NPDC049518]|uniref:mersacidin/lichenicidin family type 2 lantibiotic n=1 Tax=unclassified Asanoa TaxID=2685164 RepID=UPI00343CB365
MKTVDLTRAWKDPEYRAGLDPAQVSALPAHPAGVVEMTDDDLAAIDGAGGGAASTPITTTLVLTWEAGCFTINNTWCNGGCAFLTIGNC